MNKDELNKIFVDTLSKCVELLDLKGAEYTANHDRLSNFKGAAYLQGKDFISALGGMMSKHTVSIYDFIRRYSIGENIPPKKWDEKIFDHINYLVLLRALLREIGEEDGKEK